MEERRRRLATGKASLSDELWRDGPSDRRTLHRMGEVWKQMRSPSNSLKDGWLFCEECYRIARKRDIRAKCEEQHTVWTSKGITSTYPVACLRDLMIFLQMRRNDRTMQYDHGFEMPDVPRKKRKSKKKAVRKPESRSPSKSAVKLTSDEEAEEASKNK